MLFVEASYLLADVCEVFFQQLTAHEFASWHRQGNCRKSQQANHVVELATVIVVETGREIAMEKGAGSFLEQFAGVSRNSRQDLVMLGYFQRSWQGFADVNAGRLWLWLLLSGCSTRRAAT